VDNKAPWTDSSASASVLWKALLPLPPRPMLLHPMLRSMEAARS